jgi:proline dehydrogenase
MTNAAQVVNLKTQHKIISKLVFGLVKKHIAGSTSGAVLNVVRDLNRKGFHTTVTLLNDHVDDQSKAKYNANAYVQFIKQLSRLHLNSDVSIRLSQMGYWLDRSTLERNFQCVADAANMAKQRLWIEEEPNIGPDKIMPLYRKFKSTCSTLGAEISPDTGVALEGGISGKDMLKLKFMANGKGRQDRLKLYKGYISSLSSRKASITIMEDDPKLISGIVSASKGYRRNLIFEIPLGYSGKRMALLQRSKLNLSFYVPYGKDWIPYFINRLEEGKVKRIAVALLNGEKSDVGQNARKIENQKAG